MTPTSGARRSGAWILFGLALALATWGRILIVRGLVDQGWFTKYFELAGRFLDGRTPVDRLGDVSAAYFWAIVALRTLGSGVTVIRELQIAGVTVAALLCALAAKRLGGWVAAVATAVLILGNRAALVISTELEPEVLILIVNSAAILAVVVWMRAPRVSVAAAAGLLLGLSTTARPVALGIVILITVWMAFSSRRSAAALIGTALVPILLLVGVNWSLTGSGFIMQPGSQFYDGNNPLATGAAGVLPRIVADIERTFDEPDYLHVAYRIVAAGATGEGIDPYVSNRYWSDKAIAFIRTYPGRALELFGWKAVHSIHNYDIYDLLTTKMKGVELRRYPAIPFGLIFALAVVALSLHRPLRDLLPLGLFAAATLAALIVFNVSARQRNALLAPLAVVGGVGTSAVVRLARARSDRALIAFGAVIVITPLLGINGAPVRENDYVWLSLVRSESLESRAKEAMRRGDRAGATDLAALASIYRPAYPSLVSGAALRRTALRLAAGTESPQQLYDAAVALERVGAWREAETILAAIDDYRPLRENRSVSSVAWYRARAALRLGQPRAIVDELLGRAAREAPGDPHVLALRAVLGDGESAVILDRLHDPFTRDFALASAYATTGDLQRAETLAASVSSRMPRWRRPELLRHALRTAGHRSGSSGAGR